MRLLDYFDRISEAPEAIPRFRHFILDLAVRGKLVEQDSCDEPPASSHSRREFEHNTSPTSLPSAAHRFCIPPSWRWVTLSDVSHLEMGQSPPSEHYNQAGKGLPFYQGKTDFGKRHPTPRYWCNQPTKVAHKGDILISVRAPVGPTNVADEECCIGRGLAAIQTSAGVDREFLLLCLKSFEADLSALGFGTTFVAMNKKQLLTFSIPLPPLGEQHRIVAKVDELMALCDRLEAAQGERERRRDVLVTASLNRLNQPPADAPSFREHASFHLDHLHRLVTESRHLEQLRQTILALAVHGKLVAQDPADEPAAQLLRRIGATRSRLGGGRAIKKSSALPPIDVQGTPYRIPTSWAWARFPDLGEFSRGKSRHRPRNDPSLYKGGVYKLVQTGDVARARGVITTYTGLYNEAGLRQSKLWPAGTMCITIAANIADTALLGFDACIPDSVVGFIPFGEFEDAKYFEFFMRTAKANLEEFAPSTAQKNINIGILEEVLIPIPPLPEQRRIVAKVEELMAICDCLEASLACEHSEGRRFLEAVLHDALFARSDNGPSGSPKLATDDTRVVRN